jgi:hypothetical protein
MASNSLDLPVEQMVEHHSKPKPLNDDLKFLWSQLRQDTAAKLAEQEILARVIDSEDSSLPPPIPYTCHTWMEPVWPFVRPLVCEECKFKTDYSIVYITHVREHMDTWKALELDRENKKREPPPPENSNSESQDQGHGWRGLCSFCLPHFINHSMPCLPRFSE